MDGNPGDATVTKWNFGLLMPNVILRSPFDFGDIVIAAGADERLEAITQANPAAKALMEGFAHCLPSPFRPSVVIFRQPHQFKDLWSAMVDARNCVAVACACFGWIHSIGCLNKFFYRETDHFDFFPRWPNNDGKHLMYQGAAQNFMTSNLDGFRGFTHPYLSVNSFTHVECDSTLLKLLVKSWHRIHVSGDAARPDHQLMRALSVAYEACRVPQMMENPIYDHGKHCSFWVSALETLAAPDSRDGVRVHHVTNLIARRRLDAHELAYEAEGKDQNLNPDVLEQLYKKLYALRNEFLHGNPITEAFLIPPFLGSGIRLLDTAPLIFHAALEAYTWGLEGREEFNAWNGLEGALVRAHWSEENELKSRGEL